MNRLVFPVNGVSVPLPSAAAVSRVRAAVVPTATIRPPRVRRALSTSAAPAESSAHSECITWLPISSASIGRKVPMPTCKVRSTQPIPRVASSWKIASLKCEPGSGCSDRARSQGEDGLIPRPVVRHVSPLANIRR